MNNLTASIPSKELYLKRADGKRRPLLGEELHRPGVRWLFQQSGPGRERLRYGEVHVDAVAYRLDVQ